MDEDTLWNSWSPVEKFQHHTGSKKIQDWIHLRGLRGTVSLYMHHPFTKAAQLSVRRDPLGRELGPQRKWKRVSEHPASPAVYDAARKARFPLAPARILRRTAQLRGGEAWGEQQLRLRDNQRNTDSTNCLTVSIRSLICESLGTPHLRISPAGPWAPSMFTCLTHTAPPHGRLPMCSRKSGECEPLQMASDAES